MEACTAVTAEDIHLALGIPFHRTAQSASGPQSTCDYASGSAQVSVTIQQLAAPLDFASEIAALQRELPGSSARILDDASFLLEIPGAGAQLHIVRGGRQYVMVSILGLGDAGVVGPAARRLVRTALARL
jgi:hypothetical protein